MAPAVDSTLQPLTSYFEAGLVAFTTVARSTKHTFKASVSEHPYTSLFLVIFGISLLPMSSTVVLGTTVLVVTGILSLLSAAVIFAPIMVVLLIVTLSGWLAGSAILATYRVLWADPGAPATTAKNSKPTVTSLSQNERWKFFTRTLVTDVRAVPKEALSPEAAALVSRANEVQASIATEEAAKLNLFSDPSKYIQSYSNGRTSRTSSGQYPGLVDTPPMPIQDECEPKRAGPIESVGARDETSGQLDSVEPGPDAESAFESAAEAVEAVVEEVQALGEVGGDVSH